ncbi:hypothetical protein [Pseudoxanthomonas sacheonensis]|uniref:hypothetical protein n=1 Tax=Pseudoxanthomonas sacheonensis TaxID=443615 RepID=UPI0013D7A2F9|nr:hypothetical protein [Pseudoxanthomonas sacheonensis]
MTSHSAVGNPAKAGIHFDFAVALVLALRTLEPKPEPKQEQDGFQLSLGFQQPNGWS